MTDQNAKSTAPVDAVVRRFAKGQRVRWNFWTDARASGDRYGTITGEPVNCGGVITQSVALDDGQKLLLPTSLFDAA